MLRYLRTAPPSDATRPALFLDRDGVLNTRSVGGYVVEPEQLDVLDVALPAVIQAYRAGIAVVVVSNQGAIARGLATEAQILRVHAALVERLSERGVEVDAIYVCPHHPEAVRARDRVCGCRKPAPGMLLQAAEDLGLDLTASIMIGDQPSDLAAAAAAGIPEAQRLTVCRDSLPDVIAFQVAATFHSASRQNGARATRR